MAPYLLVVECAPVAEVATLRSVGAVDVVSSSKADEPPKPPQSSLALPQKSEAAFCRKRGKLRIIYRVVAKSGI